VRRLASLVLLAAALAAAGCGSEEEKAAVAETEGIYLEVDEVKYQVQISRQLNQSDLEDRGYFIALPPVEGEIDARNEVWFGVFLRAENDTDEARPTAEEFEIVDTRGEVYRPLELGDENIQRYEAAMLEPAGLIPNPDSIAAYSATGGALLLFKLPRPALDNRPLEFVVRSPVGDDEAVVELDV